MVSSLWWIWLVPESAAVLEVMGWSAANVSHNPTQPKPASSRLDGRAKSFIGLKGFALPRMRSNFRYDAYANARSAALWGHHVSEPKNFVIPYLGSSLVVQSIMPSRKGRRRSRTNRLKGLFRSCGKFDSVCCNFNS